MSQESGPGTAEKQRQAGDGASEVPEGRAGEIPADQISTLEERARAAEARAAMAEEIANRVFALAGVAQRIRDDPHRSIQDAGPLESFTAVVEALAAELDVPRAEIVRRMIEDIEERVALDRAVLAHLHLLEKADPAGHGTDGRS